MPDTIPVRLIVAYDENRVIGNHGRIPWNNPADRRHFAESTAGGTVIMGRETAVSLDHRRFDLIPLPGRTKIVVGTKKSFVTWCPAFIPTLDAAIDRARAQPTRSIWIIGGEMLYETALAAGVVAEVVASEVHGSHCGDRWFPALGPEWREVSREAREGFDLVRFTKEVANAPVP